MPPMPSRVWQAKKRASGARNSFHRLDVSAMTPSTSCEYELNFAEVIVIAIDENMNAFHKKMAEANAMPMPSPPAPWCWPQPLKPIAPMPP